MSDEHLKVVSVTGVDVEFHIAGAGSRSYAFVIDWHFRLLLALAWLVIALLILNGGWTLAIPGNPGARYAFIVFLPTLAIYFLYHPIIEVLTRGRTPGKRIAGVRIVTREGDVPSVGALAIRNLFRLVDCLPIFYVVGLVTTLVTEQHVRIGDLAAGTLLVIDHDREGKSLERFEQLARQSHLDPHTADLIDELLQRWKILADDNRRAIAVTLLARIEQSDPKQFQSLPQNELRERLQRALEGKRS